MNLLYPVFHKKHDINGHYKSSNILLCVIISYLFVFLSHFNSNAQCSDVVRASKLKSQRVSVVKDYAKIYVRYGTKVKIEGCNDYFHTADEINLIKPNNYRLICDDNSIIETEFLSGKTYVIGKLIYELKFTWDSDNFLFIRSSQYNLGENISDNEIGNNYTGSKYHNIYFAGNTPFLYSEKEKATRGLYTDKIIEGSAKFPTKIKTDQQVKKHKDNSINILISYNGDDGLLIYSAICNGFAKKAILTDIGDSIFERIQYVEPKIYVNEEFCPDCVNNIRKALNATFMTCIIESSQSEVEKVIKENEQFHEIRNVTVPAMIGGMAVTILIIALLI